MKSAKRKKATRKSSIHNLRSLIDMNDMNVSSASLDLLKLWLSQPPARLSTEIEIRNWSGAIH